MCGIVGLVAKHSQRFYQADSNLFTQMLVADSLRGTDGTGVFGTYGSGSVGWLKVGSHPYALITNPKYAAWSSAMTRKFDMVVGHNRKATAGSTNNENAHPFVHEHIILVHNGVVHDHKKMADTDVDSHAIAHSIANDGYEKTLLNLQGAFTLVWFDMNERVLRIVRNAQRPLYIVETASQIAFASEGRMLQWIGERNSKDWKDIKVLEEATLVTISQVSKTITTKKVDLYTPKIVQYTYLGESDEYTDWPKIGDSCNDSCVSGEDGIPEIPDEDAIAAAIRNDSDDMGVDEDEKSDILAFVDMFRGGGEVLFEPLKVEPWHSAAPTITGYNLIGHLRKDASVAVRASFEGSDVWINVKELCRNTVLKGIVTGVSVNPTTFKKSIQVKDVTTLSVYRSFNGTNIAADEWVHLCDTMKCTGCGGKLKIGEIEKTSVNIKNKDNTRVHCPTCVKKHMDKLPKEQQEAIMKINEQHTHVVGTTERDWDLHGAAHGS